MRFNVFLRLIELTFWLFRKLGYWRSSTKYSLLRRDWNRKGGGVAFFLSNNLRFVWRVDISCDEIESVWLEVYPGVHVIWMCPSFSATTFYDCLMTECMNATKINSNQKITISGDLNSNVDSMLPQTRLLWEFCNDLKFEMLGPMSATRITSTPQYLALKVTQCDWLWKKGTS